LSTFLKDCDGAKAFFPEAVRSVSCQVFFSDLSLARVRNWELALPEDFTSNVCLLCQSAAAEVKEKFALTIPELLQAVRG
jgi:hypothetical protein